jgi:drug/metabolite transporter (DMT)-like permease
LNDGFLGALLALGSAVAFAGNRAFVSRPLVKSDPEIPTYFTLVAGVIVTGIVMFLSNEEGNLLQMTLIVVVIFAAVGVFHFAIGRQISYIAEKNIGANQASPIISAQIVYAVLLAIALLGETVNLGIAIGTILILAGILLLEVRSSAAKRGGKIRTGYIAAFVTSVIFGLSPLLIKVGLSLYNFYASSLFMAYVAAMVFYALSRSPTKIAQGVRALPRYAFVSYVIAGILAGLGQIFRFDALSVAPVVIVVPILASHPIFTVLMTRKLAKDYEVFRPRTIGAILIVVIGTILVSIYSGNAP